MEQVFVAGVSGTTTPAFLAFFASQQELWEKRFRALGLPTPVLLAVEEQREVIRDVPPNVLDLCAGAFAYGTFLTAEDLEIIHRLPILRWSRGSQLMVEPIDYAELRRKTSANGPLCRYLGRLTELGTAQSVPC